MQTDDIQQAIDETGRRIADDLQRIELRTQRAARAALGWSVVAAAALAGAALIAWARARARARSRNRATGPLRFGTRPGGETRATA